MESNFYPISNQELANALNLQDVTGICKKVLLMDVRPSGQHCCKHITSSENVNFSSILLRRLAKGVVELSSLMQYDQSLYERLSERNSEQEILVLYDSCSCKTSIRSDLITHGSILAKTKHQQEGDCKVFYLDGGFEAFSLAYPQLCATSSTSKKSHSPLGISMSASLPVFSTTKKPASQKLCTPSEDSVNNFGPPMQILPHLVLGSAKNSSNLTQLRKMGVTAILNVSHNCPNHFEGVLEYKCIPVQDSYQADLLSRMETAIHFIDSVKASGGCVFVHCHAGISRSATISISYIMKTMDWDLSKAYDFVKQKRPCISPNLHFMGQLLEFEKQLKEQRERKVSGTTTKAVADSPFPSEGSQPRLASSPFQLIPLPKHLPSAPQEQCGGYYCSNSSALPSASAPSSLNSDKTEEVVPNALMKVSLMENKKTPAKPNSLPLFGSSQSLKRGSMRHFQVGSPDRVEQNDSRKLRAVPPKPTSLPLSQVKPYPSKHTGTDGQTHRFLRQSSTPVQLTASLPTTPDNHLKNRTPSSSSSSISSTGSSVRMAIHSLQNSPCRVVAMLGNRPESPLSFNNELSL